MKIPMQAVWFFMQIILSFMSARTEMLRDMGFEQDQLITQESVIFVVRSVQVDYLKPAKFNDLVVVTAELSLVKSASLTFEQIIKRGDDVLSTATI